MPDPPNPVISLYLDGDLSFQLGRKAHAGNAPNLKIQMHDTSHAATLVIPGYRASTNSFSLPTALQSGLFELFDTEADTAVPVETRDEEAGGLVVAAKARNQWLDLQIDARDNFWTQLLRPGHKYEIRWKEDGKRPWAYHGEKPDTDTQRLHVRQLPRPIKFKVFDDATAPPQLSVSVTPTADVCHLSGEPPFGIKVQVTSREKEPITVCLSKTPLMMPHGLGEIANVVDDDDDDVDWPWAIGCFESNDPFPPDSLFVELEPGVPFEKIFWLEKEDEDTANGGELDALEKDRSYKMNASKELLEAFYKWRKGKKIDLLAGGQDEKEMRWKDSSGPIIVEASDQVSFKVI